MSASIRDITKKRGRPKTTGKGVGLLVRLHSPELSKLDDWIARQPEPKPTRPEAIRRLVEKGLIGEGVDQGESGRQSAVSLDRQIVDQETAIAEMPEHSEPSPEAGMAAMDKALAEKDLIDMKNKRAQKNAKRK